MNTHNGWIKLYRCLLDDAVCQKSAYFHLWVTLLLKAGRKKLSKKTRIHESTIQRALKCFENEQMIEQQNLGKYRLITIKNWENFQCTQTGEQDIEQPVNSKRTAPEHHVNTYKNEKNEKNEKTHRRDFLSSEELEIQRIRQANEEALHRWLAEE